MLLLLKNYLSVSLLALAATHEKTITTAKAKIVIIAAIVRDF